MDEQTDTYFNVPKGRLKLREGSIEKALIFYSRDNTPGAKSSHFQLVPLTETEALRKLLSEAYGVLVTVHKKREIYYIDNVKFHIDEVSELGSFMEIEAGNINVDKSKEELQAQCEFYMKEFDIREDQLISNSYSDMILSKLLA